MTRYIKNPMKEIKLILSEWDPIGVKEHKKEMDEYDTYVPMILKHASNKEDLIEYLEYMLKEEIGLPYDENNIEHKADINRAADQIMSIWSVR